MSTTNFSLKELVSSVLIQMLVKRRLVSIWTRRKIYSFLLLEIISNPSLPPPRKGEVVNKWRFSNSLNQNTSICAGCCFFIEHLECYNGSCLITQCSFLWGGPLRDNIKTAVSETTSLECSNLWLQISDMGGAILVTPFKLFTE